MSIGTNRNPPASLKGIVLSVSTHRGVRVEGRKAHRGGGWTWSAMIGGRRVATSYLRDLQDMIDDEQHEETHA